jgi:catechol 2,3-dioxygenase-like lactoylglutathione lyase family enzyme
MEFHFDCVFYYVKDLDRAIEFYTSVIGLRLTSRDTVARFDIDGVLFELVPSQEPATLSGRGNARLTLSVSEIEAATIALRRQGVPVSNVRDVSNGRLAALTDPDGNEIMLWQDRATD